MAMRLFLTSAVCTAIASAAHCSGNDLCDAQVGDNAVVGSSFVQSSTSASKMVLADLDEDTFGNLDDSFDIPAASQKASAGSSSFESTFGAISFWISCTQDLFVFGFVLFVVPFIAGKLLQPRTTLKKAEKSQPTVTCNQRPTLGAAVNLGPLMKAARSGDEAQWRTVLEAVPNSTRAADSFGCTPLHVAADAGCVEMAKVLLEAGADVDVKDASEETPLHFAARSGSVETCELLLAKGAELDALSSEDVTPLVAAAKAGSESTCQLLLDRGGTCQGVSDADVPPLLSSLLMYKIVSESC
jgi:hypothetical protein